MKTDMSVERRVGFDLLEFKPKSNCQFHWKLTIESKFERVLFDIHFIDFALSALQ